MIEENENSIVKQRLKLFEEIAKRNSTGIGENEKISIRKRISNEKVSRQVTSIVEEKTEKLHSESRTNNESPTKNGYNTDEQRYNEEKKGILMNNSCKKFEQLENYLRNSQIHNNIKNEKDCNLTSSTLNILEENKSFNLESSIKAHEPNKSFRVLVDNLKKCVTEQESSVNLYSNQKEVNRTNGKSSFYRNLKLKIFEQLQENNIFNEQSSADETNSIDSDVPSISPQEYEVTQIQNEIYNKFDKTTDKKNCHTSIKQNHSVSKTNSGNKYKRHVNTFIGNESTHQFVLNNFWIGKSLGENETRQSLDNMR